jgi:hypothetical protein
MRFLTMSPRSFVLILQALFLAICKAEFNTCGYDGRELQEGEEVNETNRYLFWRCEDGTMIIKGTF